MIDIGRCPNPPKGQMSLWNPIIYKMAEMQQSCRQPLHENLIHNQNIPVSRSETGAALVSGASPAIFDMVIGGELSPEIGMEHLIGSERYAKVS